jgi:EAL domain-containing protein (putative c-di-GMP-specific phosphodiesterase class I)
VDYYRSQGFKIAIDDLGSGFAGLNMLAHLEPYMVKIDRSLVDYIDCSPRKQMLLQSLIAFCHKINVLVVAEGIERREELEKLIIMNVDLGQGNYLAKPASIPKSCSQDVQRLICGRRSGYFNR